MKWLAAVVAGILMSSSLAGWAQGVSEGSGRIEELLGFTVDAGGVTFQVRTGGCTRPENFRVERFGGAPTQLLLIRTVEDRCEAFVPYGTTFKVSYQHLRLGDRESFVVINPSASARVIQFP